jgi:hypothetical protein
MKRLTTLLTLASLLLIPLAVHAGGGGGKAPEALNKKIDLEPLSGLNRLVAEMYNENLWLYAAVCTVLMAVVGVAIAFGTDIILKAVGMEVHKIEHKE